MNDREPFIYIKQMYMKGFFDLEENCKEKIISEESESGKCVYSGDGFWI